MQRPIPPSNFRTRNPETAEDFATIRRYLTELLTWVDTEVAAAGSGGGGTLTSVVSGTGIVVTGGTGPVVTVAADIGSGAGQVASGPALATHIADVANPHAVTKTQVGLGNVTNDAQFAATIAAQYSALSVKAAPVGADVLSVEDSAASFAKKKITLNTLAYAADVNPYTRARTSPDAWDDEFDSGSNDLATRGWEIWNDRTGVVLTRSGDIVSPVGASAAVTAGTYRSRLIGSKLYLQFGSPVTNDFIFITKTSTGPFLYAARITGGRLLPAQPVSHAVCGLSRTGPASGAGYYNGASGGEFVYAGALGNTAPYGWILYLSRRVNGGTLTDSQKALPTNVSNLPDVVTLNYDRPVSTNILHANAVNSYDEMFLASGPDMTLSVGPTALTRAGVFLNTGGAVSDTICIDYIRRYPVGTWFY